MKKSKFLIVLFLNLFLIGCKSNSLKEQINTSVSTFDDIDQKILFQSPIPGNGIVIHVVINEDYTYESQEFFNINLFSLFNHYFIYDTLYYDFMFPYSQENEYYFKNVSNSNFVRSFYVQIPNVDLNINGNTISYDINAASSICKSNEIVSDVYNGWFSGIPE